MEHARLAELTKITTQLRNFCVQYNLPFFYAVPIANANGGTKYLQDGQSGSACGVKVVTDYIPQLIMVMNGCPVIPTSQMVEMEFDEMPVDMTGMF